MRRFIADNYPGFVAVVTLIVSNAILGPGGVVYFVVPAVFFIAYAMGVTYTRLSNLIRGEEKQ